MTVPTSSEVDLLQERRRELGLPAIQPKTTSASSLLIRGCLFSMTIVIIAVFTALGLGWLVGQQNKELDRLQPIQSKVMGVKSRIKNQNQQVKAMEQENLRIAEKLVAIQSGSALLEQLQRITPDGIQLKEVKVNPAQIEIAGDAIDGGDPEGFERINALMLNLAALPMVIDDGVKVLQVVRNQPNSNQASPSFLNFTMTVPLKQGYRPSEQQLRELGATGLAERFQLLRQQGVAL